MENSKPGRFIVGKSYPFIGHTYTHQDGRSFPSATYTKWEGMTLTTHLVMLTCESEHEVPIEYSEDTTKGYILRDEQGRECHNQYPTASYGQIDTSSDYRASMFDREKEELLCYTRIDNAYESIMRMESKHPDLVSDELRDIKAQILKFMEENNLKFEESDFMKQYHGAVFSYNIVEVSKGDS